MVNFEKEELITPKNLKLFYICYVVCKKDYKKQTEIITDVKGLEQDNNYSINYYRQLLKKLEDYEFLVSKKEGRNRLFKINNNYLELFKIAHNFYLELIL